MNKFEIWRLRRRERHGGDATTAHEAQASSAPPTINDAGGARWLDLDLDSSEQEDTVPAAFYRSAN